MRTLADCNAECKTKEDSSCSSFRYRSFVEFIGGAEVMPVELNGAREFVGLPVNRRKTRFMKDVRNKEFNCKVLNSLRPEVRQGARHTF